MTDPRLLRGTSYKATCEAKDCANLTTHVAHWEDVGAPGPVFLCHEHAHRRRDVEIRVESLRDYMQSNQKDSPA